MSPQPVRVVLFDLDGTLWFQGRPPDGAALVARAAAQVEPFLARRGLLDAVDARALVAAIWEAVDEAFQEPSESLRHPQGPFIVRGAFAVVDQDLSPEEGAEVWSALRLPAEALGRELYPDTVQVLSDLRARGLALALVANHPYSGHLLQRDLAAYGIGDFFDAAVSSADAGYLKPHAAPFEQALRILGFGPEDAVMVGHSLAADVEGARRLGMAAIWKRNGRRDRPAAPEADHVIDDLSEMLWLPLLPDRDIVVGRPAESLTPHEDGNANRY